MKVAFRFHKVHEVNKDARRIDNWCEIQFDKGDLSKLVGFIREIINPVVVEHKVAKSPKIRGILFGGSSKRSGKG